MLKWVDVLKWAGNSEVGGVLKWAGNSEMGGVLKWAGNSEVGGELKWAGNSEMGGVLKWAGNSEVGGVLKWARHHWSGFLGMFRYDADRETGVLPGNTGRAHLQSSAENGNIYIYIYTKVINTECGLHLTY